MEGIKTFYGLGDKKTKFDYSKIEKGKTSLDTPITEFDFTVNALNCLMGGKINYLGELVQTQRNDLFKLRNFRKSSIENVEEVVSKAGYSLGMNINYVRPDKRK